MVEEFSGSIALDGARNFGRAGSDLVQAGEGLWHVVQGVWDAGTGTLGAVGRAAWGTVELGTAALTALPELAIDGIGMGIQGMVQEAVNNSPQCRADSSYANTPLDSASAHHRARQEQAQLENEYTVRSGDSLWKIAADDYRQHHNGQVDNRAILETVQTMKSQYGETILPGMEITIPREHRA